MSEIIKIDDFSDPRLDMFTRLTGAQLRSKLEPEKGVFIAESPTVIEVALDSGCEPVALLTDEKLVNGSVKKIIDRCGGVPIYTAKTEVLEQLIGFALTRSVLCAMKRPPMPSLDELLKNARTVAVLENIADSFDGVAKSYAIQAGRELRVIVNSDNVDDDSTYLLCKDISAKIEENLTYPGQIRVTVIRERRAVGFAK